MGLESSAGRQPVWIAFGSFSQMHHQDEKDARTKQHAERLDAQDPLRELRDEFIIPTKADIKRKTLTKTSVCSSSLPAVPFQLTTYADYMYRMMTIPKSHASTSAGTP